ncbi:hypothetical protein [Arthrobacter sp. NPDC056493]|uniref:hypothetical protein n=1 Tax=Arthrobacter sp. NPDC056493 TaxID=3345839 RepID=UPI003671113A
MDQRTRSPLAPFPGALIPAGIVGTAAAGSAAAHVLAAASGAAGAMAWWMAAMGAACLACAAPLVGGRLCAGRAAGHLLAMSAAMILIHLVLMVAPGAAGHHGNGGPASSPGHERAMLTLIAVELLCLMSASAALRLTRGKPPGTVGTAVRAAVEH